MGCTFSFECCVSGKVKEDVPPSSMPSASKVAKSLPIVADIASKMYDKRQAKKKHPTDEANRPDNTRNSKSQLNSKDPKKPPAGKPNGQLKDNGINGKDQCDPSELPEYEIDYTGDKMNKADDDDIRDTAKDDEDDDERNHTKGRKKMHDAHNEDDDEHDYERDNRKKGRNDDDEDDEDDYGHVNVKNHTNDRDRGKMYNDDDDADDDHRDRGNMEHNRNGSDRGNIDDNEPPNQPVKTNKIT